MDESNILKIPVYNSDIGRVFDLYVRKDRLKAFQEFLIGRRWDSKYQPGASGMPGLSWTALQGLDAVFDRRPKSFPVRDILQFLADDITLVENLTVTPHEVESALEQFSTVFPPDVSESV